MSPGKVRVSISLDADTAEVLARLASQLHTSRSSVIRMAVRYLEKIESDPRLKAVVENPELLTINAQNVNIYNIDKIDSLFKMVMNEIKSEIHDVKSAILNMANTSITFMTLTVSEREELRQVVSLLSEILKFGVAKDDDSLITWIATNERLDALSKQLLRAIDRIERRIKAPIDKIGGAIGGTDGELARKAVVLKDALQLIQEIKRRPREVDREKVKQLRAYVASLN
jgi:Arc/MetJ-type ribon-helix-helix transcriptional regulator